MDGLLGLLTHSIFVENLIFFLLWSFCAVSLKEVEKFNEDHDTTVWLVDEQHGPAKQSQSH